ncbi:hypothetical protein CDL12_23465 [Handroanthus impetiginosus]|uniref:Uncharacterized protein n=1 Tax=Handroanthus impetiginosus TaxID=429701 RepID=A0A2G9GFP0_9LAMI|nr:hypothetical protein CDL12_23465 [Handroanthus impetiginosus]
MAAQEIAALKVTTAESFGVITRSMSKNSQLSSDMAPSFEAIEKSLPYFDGENNNGLAKHVQEQDSQITKLMNKVDGSDTSRIMGKQPEAHDEVETSIRPQSNEKEKQSVKQLQVSFDGLILVYQLKEFIMRMIKDKLDGSSKSSLAYTKPYNQRTDNLKMLIGYQPPKFQQFDGNSNPKQHQFVQSLKENAFDWLFVAGYAHEQRVNRILINGGSAINILPLCMMIELGISMDELVSNHLMIQGFNQGSKWPWES